MNREQRRHQVTRQGQIKINYGHTATAIVLQFDRPVDNVVLTVEQADEVVEKIESTRAQLREWQKQHG